MLSYETIQDGQRPHPYWYARVVGIFHVDVRYSGPDAQDDDIHSIEILWVRWLGRDTNPRSKYGWKAKRPLRVGFVMPGDSEAFGFVHPKEVIRGVHLIPEFAEGQTDIYLGKSMVRQKEDNDLDWWYYLVMP